MGVPVQGVEHRPKRRATGFTLLEVMIAIVIVGILAALAVVQFNTYREQAKLRSSAQKVYQILSWARLQSEKKGETLLVLFTLPYVSVWEDKNASGTVDAGDTRILCDSVENTVILYAASASPPDISAFTTSGGFSTGTTTCGSNGVCCDKTGNPTKPTWAHSVVGICARTLPQLPSLVEDGAIYLGSSNSGVKEKWAVVMNLQVSQNPSLWTSQKAPAAASDWSRVR